MGTASVASLDCGVGPHDQPLNHSHGVGTHAWGPEPTGNDGFAYSAHRQFLVLTLRWTEGGRGRWGGEEEQGFGGQAESLASLEDKKQGESECPRRGPPGGAQHRQRPSGAQEALETAPGW